MRYDLTRLVYMERHEEIATAIQRGTDHEALSRRAWKVRLIRKQNPDWDDLYENPAVALRASLSINHYVVMRGPRIKSGGVPRIHIGPVRRRDVDGRNKYRP